MWQRFKKTIRDSVKKILPSRRPDRQIQELQFRLANLPYEIYDQVLHGTFTLTIPAIVNAADTLAKILQDRSSLARFGDGEFSLMRGGDIHFQKTSPRLAQKLKDVIASDMPGLLIGLPDCFGALEEFTPPVADFWRKWMARKREAIYSHLTLDRVYYSAFFTRVYMPYVKTEARYRQCSAYFAQVKRLWAGRDVVICEGEGTRFGMFNDLLDGAASIRRILCPARSAFDQYDAIVSAVDALDTNVLVLAALGPTATVLAYDLCKKGFQTIDIGHLDVEYEWFLRKDTEGRPLAFKYVDGSDEGRKVHEVDSPEYEGQIIKKIV